MADEESTSEATTKVQEVAANMQQAAIRRKRISGSRAAGKRGGVMLAQVAGRWTVTMVSHFGPGAPADLNGFIEFSRSLPAPDIYEGISGAEPLGEAAVLRFPAAS